MNTKFDYLSEPSISHVSTGWIDVWNGPFEICFHVCLLCLFHQTCFSQIINAPLAAVNEKALWLCFMDRDQQPQEFLALIWSTSERWKAESTLEPPSVFKSGTSGLGSSTLNTRPLLDPSIIGILTFTSNKTISPSKLDWKNGFGY